ncbi:efflux RND transporter periplasmic adaptor subunit [Aliiruegeria lutimaris]|uniref:RND family efflux transporter, MFP subunit n=1 Tax=Aliiruegeria lutimaris TaxID=571298 RepID=A0A1G8K342_9RHOB|nr:efflux RND transporter periplasmic adaptor subunit [Aliiruegeria lutimaris]SDI37809.1 RND family efflux transporter, MFP subunit [Aliiruegeria lutimaris]
MKTRNAIVLALGAGIVALAAFAQTTMSSETEPKFVEQTLKPVKLMVIEGEDRVLKRQFFGKVVARRTVDLAFQVSGQIQKLPVTEGSRIGKGAMIAELDLRPFELALQQAKLSKEQADRTVDRLEKLKGSTVGQVAIDDAVTSAQLAEIAVENAEIALDDASLLAPFDALVASRSVENFTTIGAGTPVVRLHDMSEIRVEIDVPEVLVQKAQIADNLTVLAKFPASDASYAMTVRELTAETAAIGQTYRATFGMPPPDGLDLLPGSSVTVSVSMNREGQRIIVPASAVMIDNDGSTHVFRYDPKGAEEGTLSRIPVSVSPTEDGRVEIVAGISIGDEIVLAGVNELEHGQKARRFTGFGK